VVSKKENNWCRILTPPKFFLDPFSNWVNTIYKYHYGHLIVWTELSTILNHGVQSKVVKTNCCVCTGNCVCKKRCSIVRHYSTLERMDRSNFCREENWFITRCNFNVWVLIELSWSQQVVNELLRRPGRPRRVT
jgi:hypothetical protein